jgi:hypothetical protein
MTLVAKPNGAAGRECEPWSAASLARPSRSEPYCFDSVRRLRSCRQGHARAKSTSDLRDVGT